MNDPISQMTEQEIQEACCIPLTQGKFAIVDACDYEWLSQWKWGFDKAGNGYARRCVWRKGQSVKAFSMHREILKAPKGMYVDHINGNGLDNRRSNIRLCTAHQNAMNKVKSKSNASGFKGVSFNKSGNSWKAVITVNGCERFLGCFQTPVIAVKMRLCA